jgi:hypothetical protein
MTELWPPAALATLLATLFSGVLAFVVARHQGRSAAVREMHDRQTDVSLDISGDLLTVGDYKMRFQTVHHSAVLSR